MSKRIMYDPEVHHRRTIRLPGCDYSNAGYYAVTMRIHDVRIRLSNIVKEKVELTAVGEMVEREVLLLPSRFPDVSVDAFVIMPDHFHGIFQICERLSEGQRQARPLQRTGLSQVVQTLKSASTNQYIAWVKSANWPAFDRYVWQRNYYERIVRDHDELVSLRNYITLNPARWSA